VTLDVRTATACEWGHVVRILGERGGYADCWCLFWRLTNQRIAATTPEDRRAELETLMETDPSPGLLAYRDDVPVGWCQVAPRPQFVRLFHTRAFTLDEPDNASVWSVMCVYVVPAARGQGVGTKMIEAAFDHARRQGARTVEGYPLVDRPRSSHRSTGSLRMFLHAGFSPVEGGRGSWCVTRRSARSSSNCPEDARDTPSKAATRASLPSTSRSGLTSRRMVPI
jgi:GNAT superfamily N-acetyltransferase